MQAVQGCNLPRAKWVAKMVVWTAIIAVEGSWLEARWEFRSSFRTNHCHHNTASKCRRWGTVRLQTTTRTKSRQWRACRWKASCTSYTWFLRFCNWISQNPDFNLVCFALPRLHQRRLEVLGVHRLPSCYYSQSQGWSCVCLTLKRLSFLLIRFRRGKSITQCLLPNRLYCLWCTSDTLLWMTSLKHCLR